MSDERQAISPRSPPILRRLHLLLLLLLPFSQLSVGLFPLLLISASVLIRLIGKTITCSAEMNLSKHAVFSLVEYYPRAKGWIYRISLAFFDSSKHCPTMLIEFRDNLESSDFLNHMNHNHS